MKTLLAFIIMVSSSVVIAGSSRTAPHTAIDGAGGTLRAAVAAKKAGTMNSELFHSIDGCNPSAIAKKLDGYSASTAVSITSCSKAMQTYSSAVKAEDSSITTATSTVDSKETATVYETSSYSTTQKTSSTSTTATPVEYEAAVAEPIATKTAF